MAGTLTDAFVGVINKAIDVAPDIYELSKSGVAVGSTYPSGASNPGAVKNEVAQERTEKVVDGTYKNYVLIGVGVVAVLALVIVIAKKT